MEIIIKCTAAALIGSAAAQIIKKTNPELSFAVSASITVTILLACLGIFNLTKDLLDCAEQLLGSSSSLLRPLVKCAGIGFISKFGADLCRDASQAAAASSLEFAGAVCAMAVAAPMIVSVMKMIGTMV